MAVVESSPLAAAPLLTDVTAAAEPLTLEERRQIVRTAQVLIEQVYVHLPLKRAMHAVDPVQRLRLLDHRLESYSDRRFQDEMISIFVGLRDLHTAYTLPAPYAGRTATLPFRIESFSEGETVKYLVTNTTAPEGDVPPFAPGVEVTHWNGIPIDRAVDLNGERNAGSNVDARHARGLASLTQRSMSKLAPPEEEWVDVTFVADGAVHEQRFPWRVIEPAPAPGAAPPHADAVAEAVGLDALTEEIRRAQKLLFAGEAIELEQAMAEGADEAPAEQLAETSTLPDIFEFRTVPGPQGELGYLRIRSFQVPFTTTAQLEEEYLPEVLRILDLLPQNGLIIDVRGNGGGKIAAGEMLLQLFTPRRIEPERLHFINTPLTLEAASKPGSFEPWHASIEESVETGAPFSDGLPLAPGYPDLCNKVGQRYYGPVALVTDALCYSTTDIFAAGFQDHEIGPIIGTSGNTGAGGANVLEYPQLMAALPDHFKPLPKQAAMRVAIRRSTRVGARVGDPLEDLGVVPDHVHPMTRRDLLERNVDLIAEVGQVLANLPRRALAVEQTPHPGGIDLTVETTGLDRLDVLLDERPRETLDVTDGQQAVSVPLAGAGDHTIELRGFVAGEVAACRKLQISP